MRSTCLLLLLQYHSVVVINETWVRLLEAILTGIQLQLAAGFITDLCQVFAWRYFDEVASELFIYNSDLGSHAAIYTAKDWNGSCVDII